MRKVPKLNLRPSFAVDVSFSQGLQLNKIYASKDGRVVYNVGENNWELLPFELARFVLRRMYEARLADDLPKGWQQKLYRDISLQKRCCRSKCGAEISKERLLSGLQRDAFVKYCSFRCERTEAMARYRTRKQESGQK